MKVVILSDEDYYLIVDEFLRVGIHTMAERIKNKKERGKFICKAVAIKNRFIDDTFSKED